MFKRTFSTEEKMKILQAWETDEYTWEEICSLYNVSRDSIDNWKYNYEFWD